KILRSFTYLFNRSNVHNGRNWRGFISDERVFDYVLLKNIVEIFNKRRCETFGTHVIRVIKAFHDNLDEIQYIEPFSFLYIRPYYLPYRSDTTHLLPCTME